MRHSAARLPAACFSRIRQRPGFLRLGLLLRQHQLGYAGLERHRHAPRPALRIHHAGPAAYRRPQHCVRPDAAPPRRGIHAQPELDRHPGPCAQRRLGLERKHAAGGPRAPAYPQPPGPGAAGGLGFPRGGRSAPAGALPVVRRRIARSARPAHHGDSFRAEAAHRPLRSCATASGALAERSLQPGTGTTDAAAGRVYVAEPAAQGPVLVRAGPAAAAAQ